MAQHTLARHPLVVRQTEVVRVVDVTPRMRRVTLGGPQLSAFTSGDFDLPGFISEAFDDHIKLVFAADGDIEAALPVQRARSIDWPPSEHRQGRDYTVRRWDPAAGELDVDFVLHGDGPAADWAAEARAGDSLHFAGPKSSVVLPDDIEWVILAGDETALPAIARFLDERTVDAPVQVVVEVRHGSARQELALRDGDTIRWVMTAEHAPSAIGTAVQEVPWWRGRAYVWVAGESRSLIPLRNWLRRDRELPPSHMNVTGYWRADSPSPLTSAGDAAQIIDTEGLLSPLPWLATRAAIEIGLLDDVGGTGVPLGTLAARLDVDGSGLRSLIDYLGTLDVLSIDDRGVAIGPVGEEILGDNHLRAELFGTGYETRALHALMQLGPALREGVSPWRKVTGHALADDIESDPVLYADRVEAAAGFAFVAAGVMDLPAWKEATRIAVTGPGSLVLVDALENRETGPEIVIGAAPVPLRVLADLGANLPVRFVAQAAAHGVDLVVSTLETQYRDDVELAAHLSALTRLSGRVLLIDALQRTGPGGPDMAAEHHLISFGGTGAGPRTAADIERAARACGWRMTSDVPLGWDYEVFDLSVR